MLRMLHHKSYILACSAVSTLSMLLALSLIPLSPCEVVSSTSSLMFYRFNSIYGCTKGRIEVVDNSTVEETRDIVRAEAGVRSFLGYSFR